ncbi:MAG: FliA/WhiG family RNA polymerase sigma factor [Armatimonadetes bacterium]|nr:FliA/WhiG family RNA polymerase sigma factor [Armatimonadota bacterium]
MSATAEGYGKASVPEVHRLELKEIWVQYKTTGNKETRDALITQYLPLVKHIAGRLMRSLRQADFDDLVSDGVFGLIRAIDQFDLERGVKFETYATPVVRGSILNGLRALDWVPERTRTKTRELQKAMAKFMNTYGRQGTEEELAAEMRITASEVYDLVADLGTIYLISLDQPIAAGSDDEGAVRDTVEDQNAAEPYTIVEFTEQRDQLRQAIGALPEREQELITLHYYKGQSFEEIARNMKVSKQRISQLHTKAVKKLRDTLSTQNTLPFDEPAMGWEEACEA